MKVGDYNKIKFWLNLTATPQKYDPFLTKKSSQNLALVIVRYHITPKIVIVTY